MRGYRLSLATLMGLVVLVALGVVGLRESTHPWAAGIFYATIGLIVAAVLTGCLARGVRRATRLGFALFAGSYLALMLASPYNELRVPRSPLGPALDAVDEWIHPGRAAGDVTFVQAGPGSPIFDMLLVQERPRGIVATFFGGLFAGFPGGGRVDHGSFRAIAHSLVALVLGAIGGAWAGLIVWRGERASGPGRESAAIEESSAISKVGPSV